MWEAFSVGIKMLALIVIFSLIALAFGVGIVKMSNKRARERQCKLNSKK